MISLASPTREHFRDTEISGKHLLALGSSTYTTLDDVLVQTRVELQSIAVPRNPDVWCSAGKLHKARTRHMHGSYPYGGHALMSELFPNAKKQFCYALLRDSLDPLIAPTVSSTR